MNSLGCPMSGNGKVTGSQVHAFGFKLFAKLCDEQPSLNVILSPLVVASALAVATAGATSGGPAELELLGLLGVASHTDSRMLSEAVLSGEGASVRAANAVFTRSAIKPEYVKLVQETHEAHAGQLGGSFTPVNEWVSAKTEGRIQHLLDDPPDPLVVAVLVSAVFFKGSWSAKFDQAATIPGTFTTVDGKMIPAQLMHRSAKMEATSSLESLGGASVLRLDYGSGGSGGVHEYCALFILPQKAGLEALTETVRMLSTAPSLVTGLESQQVKLSLPKMKAAYGTKSLKSALRTLGLASAFDGTNVFGAMSDDPRVHIDDVVTKAILEIDEEGTIAAAAAAVIMKARSIPRPPLVLAFDRPFLMAIIHVPSGAPLFLAQIHEPGS